MLQRLYNGLDDTSLFGSYISTNDDFIFVSSNGYNIFNGAVFVYYNNISHINDKIKLVRHSIIHCPEKLNSNFGIKTAATNRYLAVSSIAYDIYEGLIYIYEFTNNKWGKTRKIHSIIKKSLTGFGNSLMFINDSLIVTNFHNEIFEFKYDYKFHHFKINRTIPIIKTSEINFNVSIITDNTNNLFMTNLTNILTIYNLNSNLVSYFIEKSSYDCFYGSYIHISDNLLFVSCSLYYPFDNILSNIISQIFVYSIIYENNNVKTLLLEQVITAPNDDIYFGTNIHVNNNGLIIAGKNAVYNYINNNKEWELTNKYNIPESYVSFDYKVKLLGSYFIVGNYGFNELQGALFAGYLKDDLPSTIIDNISDITINNNSMLNKILVILSLMVLGIIAIPAIMLTCYFIVSLLSPRIDEKKKKKDDEEDSPYKVYSYVGYVETDDVPLSNIINPHYNTVHHSAPYNYNYYYSYYQTYIIPPSLSPLEKGKKIEMDNKETVVSYKGFTYDSIQEKYKETIKPILTSLQDEIKKNNIK